MDKTELGSALHSLHWKQAELSRRLGVHPNTVSAWSTGASPIPPYVSEYLRVMMLAMEILR